MGIRIEFKIFGDSYGGYNELRIIQLIYNVWKII